MILRYRALRSAALASALGLAALVPAGCGVGASDDKLGSSYPAGSGGGEINNGGGIRTETQGNRDDKGDNPGVGTGTGRPDSVDASKTGGLGGTRGSVPPGPGMSGVRSDSPPPKPVDQPK